jgi:hypothetical protein
MAQFPWIKKIDFRNNVLIIINYYYLLIIIIDYYYYLLIILIFFFLFYFRCYYNLCISVGISQIFKKFLLLAMDESMSPTNWRTLYLNINYYFFLFCKRSTNEKTKRREHPRKNYLR